MNVYKTQIPAIIGKMQIMLLQRYIYVTVS